MEAPEAPEEVVGEQEVLEEVVVVEEVEEVQEVLEEEEVEEVQGVLEGEVVIQEKKSWVGRSSPPLKALPPAQKWSRLWAVMPAAKGVVEVWRPAGVAKAV